MTPYHFTARFRGLDMNYHGEIRPLGADVINAGRTALTRKIKEWGLTSDDLIFFEIYDNDRKRFFVWGEKPAA